MTATGSTSSMLADQPLLALTIGGIVLAVAAQMVMARRPGIGIGMRKSDSALKEKLNAAITKLKESGELNTMIKKWFGDEAKTF